MTEVARHLSNLSSVPGWNLTTDKVTARALLAHEWVFCQGDMRDICVRHLGLGVYKVWTEPR
jgi:hypothetical protein